MEYDDFTLQSFSTSVAHARTESSLVPDERLYEMLVETKLKHERLTALLQEKEDAARVDRQNRDANRELLHNLLEADSERQVVQNERMSTVEAELLELKQHLRAYDRDTLKESLCLIKPPAATDEHDNATKKIFEVLFFNKPMKLLKMLERRKDVVKWNELPR